MTRLLAGLLAAVLLSGPACSATASEESLTLRIENGDLETIRCVAILAHFVTRPLPAIAVGDNHEIALLRDPESGSLGFGSHDGSPMMLENILCGRDSNWTDSAGDLPLHGLRSDSATQVAFRCAAPEGRMACELR